MYQVYMVFFSVRKLSKNEIESEKNSCDEPGTVRPTD